MVTADLFDLVLLITVETGEHHLSVVHLVDLFQVFRVPQDFGIIGFVIQEIHIELVSGGEFQLPQLLVDPGDILSGPQGSLVHREHELILKDGFIPPGLLRHFRMDLLQVIHPDLVLPGKVSAFLSQAFRQLILLVLLHVIGFLPA